MIDRSGRTYEEYRQLYWLERDRRRDAELKVANFESDAYVLSLLTKLDELESQLEAIKTKLRRWQATLDMTINPHNPVMQQARDDVLQDCIRQLQAILGERK